MRNIILKFGNYGFLLSLILFLVVLSFGEDLSSSTQVILSYVTMTVSLCFVFFGIKSFRDNVNSGKLSIGQAFTIGMAITLLTSLGIGLADYLYTTVINPDFYEEYKAMLRANGFQGKIPEYSSGFMALLMSITVLSIGVVITVISSLSLKRE